MYCRNLLMLIVLALFPLSSFAVNTYEASEFKYFLSAEKFDRALRKAPGYLRVSDEKIPADTQQARALFAKVCDPQVQEAGLKKTVEVQAGQDFTQLNFRCESVDNFSAKIQTVQFIASLDDKQALVDLQVLQIQDTSDVHRLTLKDSGEVMVAVAAGTLVSGLLARGIYNQQQDKVLHAIAGNLVAASAAVVAYYGFDVSKNEAFWIGLASGVLVGLLKEVYDSQHRDRHTVDGQDAIATGVGGLAGALLIRLKFEF